MCMPAQLYIFYFLGMVNDSWHSAPASVVKHRVLLAVLDKHEAGGLFEGIPTAVGAPGVLIYCRTPWAATRAPWSWPA